MCLKQFVGKKYLIYGNVIEIIDLKSDDEVLCKTWEVYLKNEKEHVLPRKFFQDMEGILPQLEYKG